MITFSSSKRIKCYRESADRHTDRDDTGDLIIYDFFYAIALGQILITLLPIYCRVKEF